MDECFLSINLTEQFEIISVSEHSATSLADLGPRVMRKVETDGSERQLGAFFGWPR